MNESPSYRYFAVPVWAVFMVLLLAALLMAGCGGDDTTTTAAPAAAVAAVTVESGGMALNASAATTDAPAAAPAQVTPAASKPTPGPAATATPEPVEEDVLAPDTLVTAAGTLRLYADADRGAMPLAQYETGAEFVVVEPSGDYTTYPVDQSDVRWYRVRAGDGLVGWVIADEVSPMP